MILKRILFLSNLHFRILYGYDQRHFFAPSPTNSKIIPMPCYSIPVREVDEWDDEDDQEDEKEEEENLDGDEF